MHFDNSSGEEMNLNRGGGLGLGLGYVLGLAPSMLGGQSGPT